MISKKKKEITAPGMVLGTKKKKGKDVSNSQDSFPSEGEGEGDGDTERRALGISGKPLRLISFGRRREKEEKGRAPHSHKQFVFRCSQKKKRGWREKGETGTATFPAAGAGEREEEASAYP